MGRRRFVTDEQQPLRGRQAALRALLSRRDALSALLSASAPLVGCGAGTSSNELSARRPYTFGAAGEANVAGAPGVDGAPACTEPSADCALTEANALGPFYKDGAPFQRDLAGTSTVTQPLEVRGRVLGCDCSTPLVGATVDVWQADEAGSYDNVGYALRGRITTDGDGNYSYSTVLPGAYLNGSQYRPKHIHYKVSHPDAQTLVTQLYFEGDPYIPADPLVKEALVMPLSEDSGIYRVTFDIVLL